MCTGNNATYIHRLAVRRRFAGGEVSTPAFSSGLLSGRVRWADATFALTARHPARGLRPIYERFGFIHHSDRKVGPYFVSRYEYDVAEGTP